MPDRSSGGGHTGCSGGPSHSDEATGEAIHALLPWTGAIKLWERETPMPGGESATSGDYQAPGNKLQVLGCKRQALGSNLQVPANKQNALANGRQQPGVDMQAVRVPQAPEDKLQAPGEL